MNDPRIRSTFRWTVLAFLIGWAGAARAAEADPFAEPTPPADTDSAPESVPSRSKVPPAPSSKR